MAYTLTADDITLLENFAGALLSGRSHVAQAERFGNIQIPAVPGQLSVKWSHADELAALVERAKGGSVYPTQELIDHNTGKIVVLTPGEAGIDIVLAPNICWVVYCGGPGNGSASQDEGGIGMMGGRFARYQPANVTAADLPVQGGRAIFPIPVLAGNRMGIVILGDQSHKCRIDIRSE